MKKAVSPISSAAPAGAEIGQPTPAAPDHYALEQQVGYLLRRAHQRASAIFSAAMAPHNLTPTQFAALVKIRDAAPISQNRLGRLTAMDPATMQGVIGRLGERGLINRTADTKDRRRTLLSLTEEGARLVDLASTHGIKISAQTLAPLDAAEQQAFLALLEKIT